MGRPAKQLSIAGTGLAKQRPVDGLTWLQSVAAQTLDVVDDILSALEGRECKLIDDENELWKFGRLLQMRLEKPSLTMWVASDRKAILRFIEQARDVLGPRFAKVKVDADALRARIEGGAR